MPLYLPLLTTLVLLPALGQPAAEQSVAQLLEAGIYQEETVGDLAAASEIYGRIVAREKAEASLAAQAYYRLGLCQRKQNKPQEAARTFNQLIERFPRETRWVRQARAELARLGEGQNGPVVVRTHPPAFKNDVSPELDRITVTFDQPMRDGSWSWISRGRGTYPNKTGEPSYDAARRTCALPVALEPGKVYWVGINSPGHQNFVSSRGIPAQRYVILFATAGADGEPTEIPEQMREEAKAINAAAARAGADAREPVVLSTEPEALRNDVSPELDRITVTFDQPMRDGSWSWTGGGETFPRTTGPPSYDAARTTCTLPVKLGPNKVYRVGINSPGHRNFKNPAGAPAMDYVLLFATAGTDGQPTEIPKEMLAEAREVNKSSTDSAAYQRHMCAANLKAVAVACLIYAETNQGRLPDSLDVLTEGGHRAYLRPEQLVCPIGSRPYGYVPNLKNTGDPRAILAYESLENHGGTGANFAYLDGSVAWRGDDHALELLKSIQARHEAIVPKADPLRAERLAARAWALWRQQEFAEAEKLFEQASEANPQDANIWNGLGWSRFNQAQPLNAREAFEKAVELDPHHPAALNGLGWIAKGQGHNDEAIDHWKKAVEAAPGATAALHGLAMTYMEQGEHEKAAEVYEMWLRAEPGNADAQAGLERARAGMNK